MCKGHQITVNIQYYLQGGIVLSANLTTAWKIVAPVGFFYLNYSDGEMINRIGQKDQVVGDSLKLSWDSRKLDGQSIFTPPAWIK